MFDLNEILLDLNYIKKEPLSGSSDGVRYLMEKYVKVEGEGEEKKEETCMRVTLWPEPYGYHRTPEEQKIRECFPLNQDGIKEAVEWMNSNFECIKNMNIS